MTDTTNPGLDGQPAGTTRVAPSEPVSGRGISPEEMAELDELFGGRFPPDYVQPPLDPEVEDWIVRNAP